MRTKKFIVALCFSFFMFMCSVSTVYAYNTYNRKRQTMRQSLKSTPPIIGDVASCIRPEDYLTMA